MSPTRVGADALRVPLRAAIVDLDGTMVDTVGDFDAALNAALTEIGLPAIGRPFILRAIGKGSENLIRQTLLEIGADSGHYAAAFDAYQRHYGPINGRHSEVFPGVVAGLAQLTGRGWKLACLTNKPTAFAKELLRMKGLDGYFSVVYGGDAFERKKPDPLPLLRACDALGTRPAETLMVGDSSNDAKAARAAGCPVVLMTYGYNHGEPVEAVGADAVLPRLDAIDALLGAPPEAAA
jgi:phosphoglycolate phosphatase